MTSTSHKRRADNEPASSPPAKRSRSQKPTSPPASSPRPPSSRRRTPRPAIRQPSTSRTPSVSASLDEATTTSETDALFHRIQSGITYTLSTTTPLQTTRFTIPTTTSKPTTLAALNLLRTHATLIASSPLFEIYELGVPRPDWVKQGGWLGIHDPQWWVGRSGAEVKAGPWADELEIERCEKRVQGVVKRREKRVKKGVGKGEKERDEKLREGLRRQRAGLSMCD
ncbi:uncharacterized protein J4E78_002795 [Alternaria triticimaculans]|uniref:uncharacterized protein n=1 Tax=Alternaria triticimaculans TaxID=297637 RepID=UPI0020C1F4DA|nr:uncharacterized protein J4E78_002795 [Alternaria triticimaculans]KAI4665335.1 hypothetical protein J4E78_002795 [Alternaria triticimaculans]